MAKSSSAKQPRSGKKEATTDFEKMPESGYSKSVVVSQQRGGHPKIVVVDFRENLKLTWMITIGLPLFQETCKYLGTGELKMFGNATSTVDICWYQLMFIIFSTKKCHRLEGTVQIQGFSGWFHWDVSRHQEQGFESPIINSRFIKRLWIKAFLFFGM